MIAAWVNGRVVYHDPARAPFRVIDEGTFDAAWQKSDRWTMRLLPAQEVEHPQPAGASAPGPGTDSALRSATSASPCAALVREGIAVAGAGDRPGALRTFASAADLCPRDPAPHRETAGIYALEERWPDAIRHARAAVDRDGSDHLAWQILAAGAYVGGDPRAALDAWNAVGEPRIDLVTVQGLTRTRHAVASSLLDLPPDVVLTSERLAAAEKRLGELPAADVARVNYRPQAGGRANVEAVVLERPLLPTSRGSLVSLGLHAAIEREVSVTASSLTGGGETFTAAWRWWEERPRVALVYAAPSALGLLRAEVFSEKQAYGRGGVPSVESRRGGRVSLANWTTTLLRWEIGTGLESWGNERRTALLFASADQRLSGDRVSLRASTTMLAGSFGAWASRIDAAWHSRVRHDGLVWLADGGVDLAGTSAPLALWSGAGTGQGRAGLLRAHPLLEGGRITSDVFGRRLYHASGEGRLWMAPVRGILRLAPAIFVDTARATRRREEGDAWHVDAGVGLRVAAGGSVLRIDVAKGLRDGATALSVGWSR